jgi:hypothetical protein
MRGIRFPHLRIWSPLKRTLPTAPWLAHLAGACVLAGVPACHAGDSEPRWGRLMSGLTAGLVSVWGSGADDVWAVGGDARDGQGPSVLRFDGSAWNRLSTGTSGDLWWVYGFAGGPVYLGGANGVILRFRSGAFELLPTPGTGTVYGIWGVAPDDLWATGGDGNSGGFAWRFDGATWRRATGFPAEVAARHGLFKAWGGGGDDVWFVGSDGVTLHFDGQRFVQVPSGTGRTLFTVHGGDALRVAVGGHASGVLLENRGPGWQEVTPRGARQMIGVHLRGQQGYAVGVDGEVLRRDRDGRWAVESTGLDMTEALHAVWVDPAGGAWAVGGRVLSSPLLDGVLIYKGARLPDTAYDR